MASHSSRLRPRASRSEGPNASSSRRLSSSGRPFSRRPCAQPSNGRAEDSSCHPSHSSRERASVGRRARARAREVRRRRAWTGSPAESALGSSPGEFPRLPPRPVELARAQRSRVGRLLAHRGGQVDGGNEVSLLSSGYPQGKCLTDPVHRLCDRTPLGVRAGNSRDGGDPPPPFISLELYLIRRSHRAPSSQAVPRSHRRYSRRPVQGRGIDGRRSRDRRKREPEPTRHPRAIGHTMNAGAHGLDDAHGLVPHRQRVGGMGLLHE